MTKVQYLIEKNPIRKDWWSYAYGLVLTIIAIVDVSIKASNGVGGYEKYLPTVLQLVGLTTLAFSIKQLNKKQRKFFFLKTIYSVIFLINSLIFSLWVGVIKQVVGWIIDLNTYIQWGKPKASKYVTRITNKELIIFLIYIGVIIFAAGYPISLQKEGEIFYNKAAWGDAVGFATLTTALMLNAKKRRESKLLFLISALSSIVTMMSTGQLVSTSAAVLGTLISGLSMIEWYHEERVVRLKGSKYL